jgi:hypothetical protein
MRMNFLCRKINSSTGKLLVANRNANLKMLADLEGKHLATQVGTGMYTGPISSRHRGSDDSQWHVLSFPKIISGRSNNAIRTELVSPRLFRIVVPAEVSVCLWPSQGACGFYYNR